MNGKLEFIYQFDNTSPKITMTLSPESSLPEALEAFEAFLKGAGYAFEGELDFVDTNGNIKEKDN